MSLPATPILQSTPAGSAQSGIRNVRIDPRIYQIATLSGLLIYGLTRLDFEITLVQAALTIACTFGTQWLCTRLWHDTLAPPLGFDPRSALISGLSLCLLLRTNHLALAAAAAIAAIASKFVLRWRGKHLFNPTNFGIVALMLATNNRVWVSPGQWGNIAFFGFLMACLGGIVVNRAARADVTLAWLVSYLGLVVGRSLWLGEPMTIPLHRLQSGGLLLFSFFMISDPKTTPDSRAGRILFAALVAYGAWYIQYRMFHTNGVLWALAIGALLVPLIDWLLPGQRYQWRPSGPRRSLEGRSLLASLFPTPQPMPVLRHSMKLTVALIAAFALLRTNAGAFCGFYVAKADAKLFNKASQVVLVRDEDKTVLTMASDYRGELDEFAVVVPVPTALERGQINVANKALIEHLDAYSSPRLVEYYDPDPCQMDYAFDKAVPAPSAAMAGRGGKKDAEAAALGVTIEAQYTVGEYDILILSAAESNGLETWLRNNGYKIPAGAGDVLGSYIKQKMHFFVAKVNLAEQSKLGFTYLRPLQVAYNSPKFMLPIRLGMVNADGPQDLVIYALTRKGRIETTNYRTVKVPTGMEVPLYVKEKFGDFYRAMFDQQVEKEGMHCVFTEYAWDMGWCDPCAADPLSAEELRKLGVFWESKGRGDFRGPGSQDVYVTRLHVRYDKAHFPEDLVFQETGDRQNFQGRYVLRHPWAGKADCAQAKEYLASLPKRHEQEAETLASLTGWDLAKIRGEMHLEAPAETGEKSKWWERIFK